jgi:RNA polymerase sigma factor (sigma-70 family)
LLTSADVGGDEADAAWRAFVAEHTRLLLHVARSVFASHDEAMDAYAFALEQLRCNDYHRLREFAASPRCKVSTWLVVIVRRLCLDLYRQRYGRARSPEPNKQRDIRRRLQDLATDGLDWNDVSVVQGIGAELSVRQAELSVALDQAMATLSPSDQLILRLRFDDDLSAQEIARLLNLPSPFHVYRRVNSLLAQLRRTLGELGVESSTP